MMSSFYIKLVYTILKLRNKSIATVTHFNGILTIFLQVIRVIV